jgi:protocatechuate 3,4-dioxygenase beta subunit
MRLGGPDRRGTTAAIATASTASTTGTITGTISDPSGYPLPGITIRLFKDGADEGTLVGRTTTNSAGRYRFTGLQAEAGDAYRVEGMDPTGAHVFLYSSFDVGSGSVTTHNATMKLAGYIQGKVSTKDGTAPAQPGRHVSVTAYGENAVETVDVSAKGTFRVGGLPAGRYVLELLDRDDAFATQCYDNVRMGAEGCEGTTGAARVTVTAGKATTITPQVLDHPTSQLGGTVTEPDGKPLSSASIEVYSADKKHLIDDSYTKADGSWSVRGIAYVGKVKIVARDSDGVLRDTWYATAIDFTHATAVTLKEGSEIKSLRLTMLRK